MRCCAARRYDFGYLLKLVTCLPLPATEAEFFEARLQIGRDAFA